MTTQARPYRLFEVVGIELEYPVVDAQLTPRCYVEPAFRAIHGRPTSDIEFDNVGFSNELAAHVFEIKTVAPQRSLAQAERHLVAGLRRFAGRFSCLNLRDIREGVHRNRLRVARLSQQLGRFLNACCVGYRTALIVPEWKHTANAVHRLGCVFVSSGSLPQLVGGKWAASGRRVAMRSRNC